MSQVFDPNVPCVMVTDLCDGIYTLTALEDHNCLLCLMLFVISCLSSEGHFCMT